MTCIAKNNIMGRTFGRSSPSPFEMQNRYNLVFCTCPDGKVAAEIAQHLIVNRLAACVNILPGMTSIYRWQNAIESAQETILFIKSEVTCYALLEAEIRRHHPYELPEIIAVPIDQGLPEYLQWISACVAPPFST